MRVVPVGPVNGVPPTEEMVEACIRARPDIAVPEFPIRVSGVFDLVGSQCLAAGLIAQIDPSALTKLRHGQGHPTPPMAWPGFAGSLVQYSAGGGTHAKLRFA